MTQRQAIYDNPIFFSGYQELREQDSGLNGDLEVPAMEALLPDLLGLHIADLGCGFGEFARKAASRGANSILAIDASSKMLAAAEAKTDKALPIAYQHIALEDWRAKPVSFDLIVSSMVLHYIEDYREVVRQAALALKPGGQFIFTVEHPVCTANPSQAIMMDTNKVWPLCNYQDESLRETHWFVDGVRKHHRTVSHYVTALLDGGFTLLALKEPTPTEAAQNIRPDWVRDMLSRPPVLLLKAQKN